MSAQIDPTAAPPTDARRPLWRRPAVLTLAGLAVILAIVVLTVFQPQRLLYDVAVDDDFPDGAAVTADDPAGEAAEPAATPDGDEQTAEPADEDGGSPDDVATNTQEGAAPEDAAAPIALGDGTFASRNRYTTAGTATVYELPDGSRTLRLEDFETTNGPDLFVYLTAADADASDPELERDFIDVGGLRGNLGNQNYALPDAVDLSGYDTVVIWCRRFGVSFGAADLG